MKPKVKVPGVLDRVSKGTTVLWVDTNIEIFLTSQMVREGCPTIPRWMQQKFQFRSYQIESKTWNFVERTTSNDSNYLRWIEVRWKKDTPQFRVRTSYLNQRTYNVICKWSRWGTRDDLNALEIAHRLGA